MCMLVSSQLLHSSYLCFFSLWPSWGLSGHFDSSQFQKLGPSTSEVKAWLNVCCVKADAFLLFSKADLSHGYQSQGSVSAPWGWFHCHLELKPRLSASLVLKIRGSLWKFHLDCDPSKKWLSYFCAAQKKNVLRDQEVLTHCRISVD